MKDAQRVCGCGGSVSTLILESLGAWMAVIMTVAG